VADAKFEEVIRLAFETAGTEGIKQAAGAIASMGDVSEEARQKAAGLLDDIGNVEKAGAAARQYEQVGKQVLEYQRQISAARNKVLELSAAVKAADEPTKAQQRELAKARSTLSDLVGEQQRELGTLRTLKTSLDGQGISTRNAASAQKDLAARTAAASANLRDMVTSLKATRDADAHLQAELAAAAAKSRTETQQYDAALGKVRHQIDENAAAAKRGGAEAAAGMESTTSAVGRLRGALAGLVAYFSFQSLIDGVKSLLSTGDQFEKFQKQLTNMYGDAAGGEKAFAWVKDFAKDTPLTLDQVMQSFIQLKNFGIDPMAGAMQAAVDQNAKLGGESERLQRITLAMGQAFAKGKLQGDDIKQMIEAGVPVWQLLSEVTGKNVQQLQKMSEAGALGKDVMQQFFAQMGKDSAGAAAEQMSTLSGELSNLQDNFQQFQDRVAKKGVLDYFKDQLGRLNDLFGKMAADGRLDAYAKRVSDSIVSMAKSLKSATVFIIEHASEIKKLIQVYALFKLGKIAGEIFSFTSRLIKLTTAVRLTTAAAEGLSVGMAVLRGAVILLSGPIGWIIGALGLFAAGAKLAADAIVDYASKHSEASAKLAESDARYKASMLAFAELYEKRAKALEEYANLQVLAADQVARLSEAERAAYEQGLKGHNEYVKAREHEAQLMIASGEASEDWVRYQKEMRDELARTTQGIKDFAAGVDLASRAAVSKLSVSAYAIAESLNKVSANADELKQHLDGLFTNFSSNTPEQLRDIALAIGNLGSSADKSGQQVRAGLRDNLSKLSGEDLLAFQVASNNAFAQFDTNVKQSSVVVEATLQTALERLGVAADQWGLKTTDAGQQNIAVFKVVANNAAASAETIQAAFSKALANATTVDDAKAIGDALQKAGEKGKVGFDATQRAVAAVEDRVRALKTAVDPLADDFARLGIKSQRALDDAAAAAKHSFDNIVRGARDGKASMNDVRAAFDGYAKAQLDSVEHAESWKRAQVQNALETQASILGVSDELTGMGAAGIDAGDHIAHGAHVARDALRETADAATEAEKSTERAGDKAESYATKMANAHQEEARKWVATGARTQVALNGLSNNFLEALASLNRLAGAQNLWRNAWNATVAEWRRQGTEVEKQVEAINKQNAAYDELQQRVEALRKTYNYLNDDQLRALAQAQQTLEQNQKRVEDEAKQKAQDQREKNAAQNAADTERWNKELGVDPTTSAAKPGAGTEPQRIAIDLSVSASQQAGAVPAQLSPTDVQKVANEVVRQIGIARTMSNR
jgi:tape measure domain-containing protein